MRWFSFDPFTHIAETDATVAALRNRAIGHDVAVRAFDTGRFERTVSGADLAKLADAATA